MLSKVEQINDNINDNLVLSNSNNESNKSACMNEVMRRYEMTGAQPRFQSWGVQHVADAGVYFKGGHS